ncbi:MLP-like protein 328 [Linum perenne]
MIKKYHIPNYNLPITSLIKQSKYHMSNTSTAAMSGLKAPPAMSGKAPEEEVVQVELPAMSGKVEVEAELKSPPAKLYNVLRKTAHEIPDHTPSKIQAIKVHDGDWESHGHGTIKTWHYTFEGKAEVFKERVEFDEQNKIIKLNGLEGDVMKIYKVFNPIFELVSSENGYGGVAKLSIEYEKVDPSFPAPTKYLDFMISLTKDTDDGLVKSG